MVEILREEKITSFNVDTFDSYLSCIGNLDFSDTSMFPMSTKGKRILYLRLSLGIYPNQKNADLKGGELQRLIKELELEK